MEHDFKLLFNKKRNYVEVWIEDSSPAAFERNGGGRWGYFSAISKPAKYGKFGELHFVKSRLRYDVIIHELFHLMVEWMWSRGETITRLNEERYAVFIDEVTRKFIRELKKIDPEVKL